MGSNSSREGGSGCSTAAKVARPRQRRTWSMCLTIEVEDRGEGGAGFNSEPDSNREDCAPLSQPLGCSIKRQETLRRGP